MHTEVDPAIDPAIDPAAVIADVHGPAAFATELRSTIANGDRSFGNALIVVRAVDLGSGDGALRADHRRAGALLARSVESGCPVGQLADDVFALAVVGAAAPDADVIAGRLELAVGELRALDPAFADLTVAVAVVDITGYDVHDPTTLFERAVATVGQERSWEERARTATLHLVGAAATLDLVDG